MLRLFFVDTPKVIVRNLDLVIPFSLIAVLMVFLPESSQGSWGASLAISTGFEIATSIVSAPILVFLFQRITQSKVNQTEAVELLKRGFPAFLVLNLVATLGPALAFKVIGSGAQAETVTLSAFLGSAALGIIAVFFAPIPLMALFEGWRPFAPSARSWISRAARVFPGLLMLALAAFIPAFVIVAGVASLLPADGDERTQAVVAVVLFLAFAFGFPFFTLLYVRRLRQSQPAPTEVAT